MIDTLPTRSAQVPHIMRIFYLIYVSSYWLSVALKLKISLGKLASTISTDTDVALRNGKLDRDTLTDSSVWR